MTSPLLPPNEWKALKQLEKEKMKRDRGIAAERVFDKLLDKLLGIPFFGPIFLVVAILGSILLFGASVRSMLSEFKVPFTDLLIGLGKVVAIAVGIALNTILVVYVISKLFGHKDK